MAANLAELPDDILAGKTDLVEQ